MKYLDEGEGDNDDMESTPDKGKGKGTPTGPTSSSSNPRKRGHSGLQAGRRGKRTKLAEEGVYIYLISIVVYAN